MQARLDRMPEAMGVRRQTVEHPFGTLKAWMGATHFLTRTLDKVRTELRCGTTDGGDQDLIAWFKPHVSVDLSGIAIVLPGNTAHRALHPTRFPTVSTLCGRSARPEIEPPANSWPFQSAAYPTKSKFC